MKKSTCRRQIHSLADNFIRYVAMLSSKSITHTSIGSNPTGKAAPKFVQCLTTVPKYNFTEKTWTLPTFGQAMTEKIKGYAKYPPRKPQSDAYSGPTTLRIFVGHQHSSSHTDCTKVQLRLFVRTLD